jgi:hypothetical protein
MRRRAKPSAKKLRAARLKRIARIRAELARLPSAPPPYVSPLGFRLKCVIEDGGELPITSGTDDVPATHDELVRAAVYGGKLDEIRAAIMRQLDVLIDCAMTGGMPR